MKHCQNRTCANNQRGHCSDVTCDMHIKPRRHYGSVYNPRTQEGRLDAILRQHVGEWIDVWTLTHLIPSAAVHTIVCNLRLQLNPGESIEQKSLKRPALERTESYYTLLLPGMEGDNA